MEKIELIKSLTSLVYKECKSVPPGIKFKIGQLVDKYSPAVAVTTNYTGGARRRAGGSTTTASIKPTSTSAVNTTNKKIAENKVKSAQGITSFPARQWPSTVTATFKKTLEKLVKEGNKLQAVKSLKDKTGMGLREAKNLIDSLELEIKK